MAQCTSLAGHSAGLARPRSRASPGNGSLRAQPECLGVVAASAAPVQQPKQKIRVKLKSYEVELLRDSVDQILEAASSTGASTPYSLLLRPLIGSSGVLLERVACGPHEVAVASIATAIYMW